MRGTVVGLVLLAATALSACGIADSRSPVPEFMRAKESEPPPPEPPPDVKHMVREKLDSVFTAASNPGEVQVSPPRRDLRGQGWTACVRACTCACSFWPSSVASDFSSPRRPAFASAAL